MTKAFILFEIQYRAKRIDTYVYFFVLFLFSVISIDFIFQGQLQAIPVHSPSLIARTMGIISALFLLVVSMIVGTPILRDFKHEVHQLLFSFPIKKSHYVLGRFIGSLIVVIVVFLAVPLGLMISPFLPWNELDAEYTVDLWSYIQPFLGLTIPTLFFSSALFFVTGLLTRKLLLVYVQGFFFMLIYLFALNLASGSDSLFLTSLIEPFTFQTIRIATATWSVAEVATQIVPLKGVLLANRLLWVCIGLVVLLFGYVRFSMGMPTIRKRKNAPSEEAEKSTKLVALNPKNTPVKVSFSWMHQLVHHTAFNLRLIVSDIAFWAILVCAVGVLVINGFSLGTPFGIDSLPTTYLIIGELVELTFFFFLGITLFYSGELMWRERDVDVHSFLDAYPTQPWVVIAGKYLGLLSLFVILFALMIATGITYQAVNGYFDFEIGLYLSAFYLEIFPYLVLISLVCFISQVLVHHKYLAHIVTLFFLMVPTAGFMVLGISHDLLFFGGSTLPTYSDMNGFSYQIQSYLWTKAYWIILFLMCLTIAVPLVGRGSETSLKQRLKIYKTRFSKSLRRTTLVLLVITSSIGGFIFYQTNIKHTYYSSSNELKLRAEYERSFSYLKELPQPEMHAVFIELDVFSSDLRYAMRGKLGLVNRTSQTIETLYLQKLPTEQASLSFPKQATVASMDSASDKFGVYKLELTSEMAPGDSLEILFEQQFRTQKMGADFNKHLVRNGTLIDDYHVPSLGYLSDIEIEDPKLRAEFGLPVNLGESTRVDSAALRIGKANGNGEYIHLELLISTDYNQTAVAPGNLVSSWEESDRAYFHYKTEEPISNMFSVAIADYEVMRSEIKLRESSDPVNLEIYHHQGHGYNNANMMEGMKQALEYLSTNISPYQFDHLKIVEVPIYHGRAQSIPGMITVAENMGFTFDTMADGALDIPFYITAHEVAHQWWGDQLNAADVPGQLMIAETLAQYSALMVFRKRYGEERTNELLKWNMRQYFKKRGGKDENESALTSVKSGEDFIYYQKGLIVINALVHWASEEKINQALADFVANWNSRTGEKHLKSGRYPTTDDLMGFIYSVSPLEQVEQIRALFEEVIIYNNSMVEVNANQNASAKYELEVNIEFEKIDASERSNEKLLPFDEKVQLGFYSKNEQGENTLIKLMEIQPENGGNAFTFKFVQQPELVIIDPNMLLLDKDISDNWAEVQW